jgi:hypothetical protein
MGVFRVFRVFRGCTWLSLVAAVPRCAVSPICKRQDIRTVRRVQVRNLRYGRLKICVTTFRGPNTYLASNALTFRNATSFVGLRRNTC